jgi:hypothetical protein
MERVCIACGNALIPPTKRFMLGIGEWVEVFAACLHCNIDDADVSEPESPPPLPKASGFVWNDEIERAYLAVLRRQMQGDTDTSVVWRRHRRRQRAYSASLRRQMQEETDHELEEDAGEEEEPLDPSDAGGSDLDDVDDDGDHDHVYDYDVDTEEMCPDKKDVVDDGHHDDEAQCGACGQNRSRRAMWPGMSLEVFYCMPCWETEEAMAYDDRFIFKFIGPLLA